MYIHLLIIHMQEWNHGKGWGHTHAKMQCGQFSSYIIVSEVSPLNLNLSGFYFVNVIPLGTCEKA